MNGTIHTNTGQKANWSASSPAKRNREKKMHIATKITKVTLMAIIIGGLGSVFLCLASSCLATSPCSCSATKKSRVTPK